VVIMLRTALALSLGLVLAAPSAAQQLTPEQRAQERERRFREDPAGLDRYAEANAKLGPKGKAPRVVFMGDSITEGWVKMAPGFFSSGRIGRGISGQTTMQMLVRLRQDVIALRPDVVQIMAATNDIAGNLGPVRDEAVKDNFRSMVEIAQLHCINVILAAIPPAADFPWRPGLNPGPRVVRLNSWLKAYARETGSVYADYWTALSDGGVGLRAEYTYDGVHPDADGYAAMAPVAEAAIARAFKLPTPRRCRRT
jgi:lysophospholipase L1-like esterase